MIDIEERDELVVKRAFSARDARRLWQFVHADRWRLAAGAALAIAGTLFELTQPIVLMHIIDGAIGGRRADLLFWLVGAYLALALGNWVNGVWQTFHMGRVGQGTLYRMRITMFTHLQALSMSFYDKTKVGRIISRMTSDIGALNELMTNGVIAALTSSLSLVGIIVFMLITSWQLALVAFVVLPAAALYVRWFTPRSRDAWREVRDRTSAVNAAMAESIIGVRVIQAMAREDVNAELFDVINRRNFNAGRIAGKITATLWPAVDGMTAVTTAAVIGVGGYWVLQGSVEGLTVGVLGAFLIYVERFFEPLRALSELYDSFQNAATSSERVFALLDVRPEIQDKPGALPMGEVRGEVEFERVTFAYSPGNPVIHELSLRIRPGETVALVGATGSGKTTLANLILRFYDVSDGAIRIDGHDVRDVTQASLRRRIAVVLQEPFIFAGTLRENITFGRPDASEADVREAMRIANLSTFVERHPFGLDTPIQERGAGLSLGERQLIAFARAILADPRILVLDEATSNVDTETERLVQQALERLLATRTAVVIAHRLSTIEHADRIIVLSLGRIVEEGNHAQLLAKGGLYARLHRLGIQQTDEITQALLAETAERT
ncbi:MAG: ABC transporter ATP-binding protein [Actinobacteria bacterium]|nr:ABC transporter ATP-binding protein [Actinomycetota bacterium]